jgi:hypothetical protein
MDWPQTVLRAPLEKLVWESFNPVKIFQENSSRHLGNVAPRRCQDGSASVEREGPSPIFETRNDSGALATHTPMLTARELLMAYTPCFLGGDRAPSPFDSCSKISPKMTCGSRMRGISHPTHIRLARSDCAARGGGFNSQRPWAPHRAELGWMGPAQRRISASSQSAWPMTTNAKLISGYQAGDDAMVEPYLRGERDRGKGARALRLRQQLATNALSMSIGTTLWVYFANSA